MLRERCLFICPFSCCLFTSVALCCFVIVLLPVTGLAVLRSVVLFVRLLVVTAVRCEYSLFVFARLWASTCFCCPSLFVAVEAQLLSSVVCHSPRFRRIALLLFAFHCCRLYEPLIILCWHCVWLRVGLFVSVLFIVGFCFLLEKTRSSCVAFRLFAVHTVPLKVLFCLWGCCVLVLQWGDPFVHRLSRANIPFFGVIINAGCFRVPLHLTLV